MSSTATTAGETTHRLFVTCFVAIGRDGLLLRDARVRDRRLGTRVQSVGNPERRVARRRALAFCHQHRTAEFVHRPAGLSRRAVVCRRMSRRWHHAASRGERLLVSVLRHVYSRDRQRCSGSGGEPGRRDALSARQDQMVEHAACRLAWRARAWWADARYVLGNVDWQ